MPGDVFAMSLLFGGQSVVMSLSDPNLHQAHPHRYIGTSVSGVLNTTLHAIQAAWRIFHMNA
jgi:hypothetical protein